MSGRQAIVFNSEEGAAAQEAEPSLLEQERDRHRQRASKFGTDYKEPAKVRKDLRLEARKERLTREGFTTGLDLTCEQEAEKRRERASRFNIPLEQDPLSYAPDPAEEKKRDRAAKFGTAYNSADQVVMDMDLYEDRVDAPLDAERRSEAVYLYGVDYLSTSDILGYFADYCATFVEWINDSSCVVVFRDEHTARRAILGIGRPLPPEHQGGGANEASASTAGPPAAAAMDEPALMDVDDAERAQAAAAQHHDVSLSNMPFLWHRGGDFHKDGHAVPLLYRMATTEDKLNHAVPRKQSRYLWQHTSGSKRDRSSGHRQQQQGGRPAAGDAVDMELDDYAASKRQKGDRGRRQRRPQPREEEEEDAAPELPDAAVFDQPEPVPGPGGRVVPVEDDEDGDTKAAKLGVSDLRQLIKQEAAAGALAAERGAAGGSGLRSVLIKSEPRVKEEHFDEVPQSDEED